MTSLVKPVRRVTREGLSIGYGRDRGRRLVATLEAGDMLTLRPLGTRLSESLSLFDIYAMAIRYRVNCSRLEKAREKKAKADARRAELRRQRELRRPI